MTNFDSIYRMHQHHRLPIETGPTFLSTTDQLFRSGFMREELLEFDAACQRDDLPEAADALIDLVVVAMGTAVMMGLPWHALWADVQRANMSKERVVSERAYGGFDLGKPEGWEPPRSARIIDRAVASGVPAPVYSAGPRIVCLCGSTKFKEAYARWNRHFTLAGFMVLSVGFFSHADEEDVDATTKAELDQLHLHKIDLADEVGVVNVGGYVGSSTQAEIDYARSRGKPVTFLEKETTDADDS
ncbi:hypothetical protein LCGC14_0252520 [marine sediment metagenome]|uniref:DUF4406 domain-containing protein n=1 Tax=marine sediment metagenome TaxID=412755 RepID=A0A0F9U4L9_9ZZZZ